MSLVITFLLVKIVWSMLFAYTLGSWTWGAWKVRKRGSRMAATHCWEGLIALFLSFVNLSSFHYKRHNQNKAYNTESRNKLECEADLRCALSSTKPQIKTACFLKTVASFLSRRLANKLLFCLLCLILRLSKARLSMTNAKVDAIEKV